MKLKKKVLLFILLMLPMVVVAGYLFKTLDAKDGLTTTQINCILKDARGFMWFGTPSGLYRYDGYTFKHFQSDSQNGSSLPDSYIRDIQQWDADGSLWIETPTGSCIYHPQTESFDRDMNQLFNKIGIKEVPSIFHKDKRNMLWCYLAKKKMVVCYNPNKQSLYEYNLIDDENGIPMGNICSIGECKDGALLVYDDGRLVCCSVTPEQCIMWQNSYIADQHLRKSNSLKCYADALQNVWLYGQGTLFLLDRKTYTWNTTIGNQLGLTGVNVDLTVNGLAGDSKERLWMATNRRGLILIDIHTYQMEEVQLNSMNMVGDLTGNGTAMGSRSKGIQSVYVDDADLLWVGTNKAGVAYWGKNIYKFASELRGDITAITQDSTGRVWYGTSDNGVLDYSGSLASMRVTAMATTRDGSVWIGSKQNGLSRIRNNGETTLYSATDQSEDVTLIDNHINAMCTDKNGNLWIATEGGMQMYNPRMNTFSSYTKNRTKLQTNFITALFYGRNNKLFIGTAEGLTIMDVSTNDMDYYLGNISGTQHFTNNFITQVYEDSRGLIWIGTREGVNVLNLETDELDFITEKQGLCNNNICGITEDKRRNIWLTTSNGVCRIVLQRDPEVSKFNYGLYNYQQGDGLQGNEFNPGAILTKRDGNVLFGGIYGVSYVRPQAEESHEAVHDVIFTQLFIGEEEILTGCEYDGRIILPEALSTSTRIELDNDQNTFTIMFAAGNYNQSERLQFKYRLAGLGNGDWKNGDAIKHGVTFENLPAGTYKLFVKATGEGGNSEKESEIEIVVAYPWWSQWWMLLVYVAILAVIVYLWKRGFDQVRDLWRRKNAVINELARQREEIKATSDDLRQPMSRMTSIIMNLAERDSSVEEREQLNNLHSQMLQVITRVSDMQAALEHPEENAQQNVRKNFELIYQNPMALTGGIDDELTYEIKSDQNEAPMSSFKVFFVDDNEEMNKFVMSRLHRIYYLRTYTSAERAYGDLDSIMPDLIVCKQDLPGMTGSELCKKIKMNLTLYKIKFVLLTDNKLSQKDMMTQDITMSADDYLAMPFNLQEAVMRFNKLLGIDSLELGNNLIEGAETRMLEDRNSSMTTATESVDYGHIDISSADSDDEEIRAVTIKRIHQDAHIANSFDTTEAELRNDSWSMTDVMDQRLLMSIEQYVQQNMSRGQISLDEMASSMGMSLRPFFQKVNELTGKTPAEVVRDLRLKNACLLLKRTNINMTELASNVGFATGEHFINIFKERFGISPTEYRQKYRRPNAGQ